MDPLPNPPADPQSDWARLLPRDAFQEIILILRGALPPPAMEDPEGYARRDRAAMMAVAALLPENAAEGRLAAQFVAADAYALDCLRLAQARRREFDIARQCRAQAMSMMREAKSALRLLLRLQARRQAIAENEAASGRAAWAEHGAVGMMQEALAAAAPPVSVPDPAKPSGGAKPCGDRMAAPAAPAGKFRRASNHAIDARNSRRETEPIAWPLAGLAAS